MSNNSPSSLPPQSQEVRVQDSTTPSIYDKTGKQVFDVLAQSKTSETSQVVADTQKTLNPLKSEVLAQAKPEFVKDSVSEYSNIINTTNAYLAEKELYSDSQKELTELSTNLAKSIDISKKLSAEKDLKQISGLLQSLISADANVNESFRKFLIVNKGEDQGFIATIISKYNNYQLDKVKLPACKKLSDAGLKCPVEMIGKIEITKDEPNGKIDVYAIALLKNMTLLQQTLPRAIYNVNAIKSNIDQLAKTDKANGPKLVELSNRLAWINVQMRDMQKALQKDGLKVGATYFPTNYISNETEAQARKDLDSIFSKFPASGLNQKTKSIDLALDMNNFKTVVKDPEELKNLQDLNAYNVKLGNNFVLGLSALINTMDINLKGWIEKGWDTKLGTFASTGIVPTDDPEFARFVKGYSGIMDFFNIFPDNFKNFPYQLQKEWQTPLNNMSNYTGSTAQKQAYEKAKALQNK